MIDTADFPVLSQMRWHALRSGRGFRPAHCYRDETGRQRTVLLYRFLLCAKAGEVVDHINGDPLDNRRCNLRIATPQQNNWNSKSRNGRRFRGVREMRGQWFVVPPISLIGPFASEEEAAIAYDEIAVKARGEFARTNSAKSAADLNVEALS